MKNHNKKDLQHFQVLWLKRRTWFNWQMGKILLVNVVYHVHGHAYCDVHLSLFWNIHFCNCHLNMWPISWHVYLWFYLWFINLKFKLIHTCNCLNTLRFIKFLLLLLTSRRIFLCMYQRMFYLVLQVQSTFGCACWLLYLVLKVNTFNKPFFCGLTRNYAWSLFNWNSLFFILFGNIW